MRILIIGGTGTIGKRLVEVFSEKHHVVTAGRNSGDLRVDIASSAQISTMLKEVGIVDAMIVAAGEAKWAPFDELSEEDYMIGYKSKLMGQVNLVRLGRSHVSSGGSITLTTGILADDPVIQTASAAMVNGAIHSFVKAASLELDDVRLNVVSAGMVEDAYDKYKDYFPGHTPVSMARVTDGYARSVYGARSGEVITVY